MKTVKLWSSSPGQIEKENLPSRDTDNINPFVLPASRTFKIFKSWETEVGIRSGDLCDFAVMMQVCTVIGLHWAKSMPLSGLIYVLASGVKRVKT